MGRRIPYEIFEVPFDVRRALSELRSCDWLEPEGGVTADAVTEWNEQAPKLWRALQSGRMSIEDAEREFPEWAPSLIAREEDDDPYRAQVAVTRALADGNEEGFVRAIRDHDIDIDHDVVEITDLASSLAPDRAIRIERSTLALPSDISRSERDECSRAFFRGLRSLAAAARDVGLEPFERFWIPSLLGQLDILVPKADDPPDLRVANSLLRELITSETDDVWIGTPPAFALGLSRAILSTDETVPNPYDTSGGFGRLFVPRGSVQAPEMAISAIDWRAGPRAGFLPDGTSSRYAMAGFLHPFEHGYLLQCNLRASVPDGGAGVTHLDYAGSVRKQSRDDNDVATAAMWSAIRALDPTAGDDSIRLGTFDSVTHSFTEPVETVLARLVNCLLARGCVESAAVRRFVAEHFPSTANSVAELERWNTAR